MLKRYRHALLNTIRESNVDPREFRAIDADTTDSQLLRLELGDSSFHFSVKLYYNVNGARRFAWQHSSYKSGHPRPNYSEGVFHEANDFEGVNKAFKEWLSEHAQKYFDDRAELEEDQALPDLWAELDLPSSSTAEPQVLQNIPFSPEEQKRIADALNKLVGEVQSNGFVNEEQIKLLHERIEYLIEASRRLGRRDWLMAAAGALIELTIEAGLKTEAAKQFLKLASETLRCITHYPPLLPSLIN